ncbi:phage DNA packaging protein J [Streptomyces sp. NPDC060209]
MPAPRRAPLFPLVSRSVGHGRGTHGARAGARLWSCRGQLVSG